MLMGGGGLCRTVEASPLKTPAWVDPLTKQAQAHAASRTLPVRAQPTRVVVNSRPAAAVPAAAVQRGSGGCFFKCADSLML